MWVLRCPHQFRLHSYQIHRNRKVEYQEEATFTHTEFVEVSNAWESNPFIEGTTK